MLLAVMMFLTVLACFTVWRAARSPRSPALFDCIALLLSSGWLIGVALLLLLWGLASLFPKEVYDL